MKENKNTGRYLKVAIISAVAAITIMGSFMGLLFDKDRIDLDIQKLKHAVSIANALNLNISFTEGYIVINKEGSPNGRQIEISTLKSAQTKEKTIQVNFKSLFFSDSIEIKTLKTD